MLLYVVGLQPIPLGAKAQQRDFLVFVDKNIKFYVIIRNN
jgi:hypothetical protein